MSREPDGADASRPYLVRGSRRNGCVTYRCATPVIALRKQRDFTRAGYCDITITAPDGTPLDEATLAGLSKALAAREPVPV